MRDPFAEEGDEGQEPCPSRGSPVNLLTSTNDEATACRYSAMRVGLLDDPFVKYFLPPFHHALPTPKAPIINRGTFLRVKSIDDLLHQIQPEQVISLGAGFDTRPFYMTSVRKWVEVDFEEVVRRKQHVIAEHIKSKDSPIMISADLEVDFVNSTWPRILAKIDVEAKTAILAECCFMYLSDATVKAILSCIGASLADVVLIIFDPLYLGDTYGRTMESNLNKRGLSTETFLKYPTAQTYKDRLSLCGWQTETFETMRAIGEKQEYRQILNQKAALDEYEEWTLLAQHYFLLTAVAANK